MEDSVSETIDLEKEELEIKVMFENGSQKSSCSSIVHVPSNLGGKLSSSVVSSLNCLTIIKSDPSTQESLPPRTNLIVYSCPSDENVDLYATTDEVPQVPMNSGYNTGDEENDPFDVNVTFIHQHKINPQDVEKNRPIESKILKKPTGNIFSQFPPSSKDFFDVWKKARANPQQFGIDPPKISQIKQMLRFEEFKKSEKTSKFFRSVSQENLELINYRKMSINSIPLGPLRGRELFDPDWKPQTDPKVIREEMSKYRNYLDKYPHLVKLTEDDFKFNPATVKNYMKKAQDWDSIIMKQNDLKTPSSELSKTGSSRLSSIINGNSSLSAQRRISHIIDAVMRANNPGITVTKNEMKNVTKSSIPNVTQVLPRSKALIPKDNSSRDSQKLPYRVPNKRPPNNFLRGFFDVKKSYELAKLKVKEDMARARYEREYKRGGLHNNRKQMMEFLYKHYTPTIL